MKLRYQNIFEAVADNAAEAANMQFRADLMLVLRDCFRDQGISQLHSEFLRCSLASLVTIVGDEHTLDAALFEERQVIGGKAPRPRSWP